MARHAKQEARCRKMMPAYANRRSVLLGSLSNDEGGSDYTSPCDLGIDDQMRKAVRGLRNWGILTLLAALCCCKGQVGVIQSIALAPGQTPALFQPISFNVQGVGSCSDLTIEWGDSSPLEHWTNRTLGGFNAKHTYSDWPGGKTVTVRAVSGCVGNARTRFKIEPSTLQIGWDRDPNRNIAVCNDTTLLAGLNVQALAPMSLVHITSPPTPVVNFGCPFNGCIYDADGKAGSSAAAPFPFLGFREFSLVLRVGPQLFQGGKNVQFTVPVGGNLELCQNTNNSAANMTGGWEVDIEVDELGTPITP
jgi:hypothetical protein